MLQVATLALFAWTGPAQEEVVSEEPTAVESVPSSGYHGPDEAEALLAAWQASGLVESFEIGTSAGGRPLVLVQLGGIGEVPLDQRPCVLLLGGLDGVSVSGSEAVVAIVDALVAAPGMLPANVTFLAMPWANPDGLASYLANGYGDGRNAQALDGDGDGRLDEDGADDLDGDGVVLELLVPAVHGAWTREPGERFPRPWVEGDRHRFDRLMEGADNDNDGRWNEDGPGGVVLDNDFPLDWRGPWTGAASGPWPTAAPGTRALIDLAAERQLACVLLFQGNHGGLGLPGGLFPEETPDALPLAADRPAWEFFQKSFRERTARPRASALPLREAYGEERPGAAIDWFYAALGIPAIEVAVWGPEVEADAYAFAEAQAGRPLPKVAARPKGTDSPASDRAWAAWLDEAHGGIGFVDWQPVDLPGGRTGWLGGWEPFTMRNPPPAALAAALHGMSDFVLDVAQSLPRPTLEVREARRDGELVFLRARVKNEGRLPSIVGPRITPRDVTLELEGPEGMQLLAGTTLHKLALLAGGAASEELEWIIVAPEGALFRMRVTFEAGESFEREMRP